jgi:hypothetical protein
MGWEKISPLGCNLLGFLSWKKLEVLRFSGNGEKMDQISSHFIFLIFNFTCPSFTFFIIQTNCNEINIYSLIYLDPIIKCFVKVTKPIFASHDIRFKQKAKPVFLGGKNNGEFSTLNIWGCLPLEVVFISRIC